MSRAFVREDADEYEPPGNFGLPPRSDPSFESAAALVLLEAARDGRTRSAEEATGYRWGDPYLFEHVRRHLAKAEALPEDDRDRRFIQVARRYLVSG
jgi:hypothetical protein